MSYPETRNVRNVMRSNHIVPTLYQHRVLYHLCYLWEHIITTKMIAAVIYHLYSQFCAGDINAKLQLINSYGTRNATYYRFVIYKTITNIRRKNPQIKKRFLENETTKIS